MGLGIPNFKHFILKRMPDGPNGKVCWYIQQEKGESPVNHKWAKWVLDKIRKEAAKLKVGETKTIFIR